MWYNAHAEVYGGADLDFVEYKSFNEKVGILTAHLSVDSNYTFLFPGIFYSYSILHAYPNTLIT